MVAILKTSKRPPVRMGENEKEEEFIEAMSKAHSSIKNIVTKHKKPVIKGKKGRK